MPDEWEKAHGLDAADASDRNLLNRDGYTALEVYLNSLMGEVLDDDFTTGISAVPAVASSMSYDAATHTLSVSADALGATLTVYTTGGSMLSAQTVRSTSVSLNGLPSGVLLLRLSGNGVSPRLIKVAN